MILWGAESRFESRGTRENAGGKFLKKSLQRRKMALFNYEAPEYTVNVGWWGWMLLCEMYPGPTCPLENFISIGRSVEFLYFERAIFLDQFSYIGTYIYLYQLGHPESQVRGRISQPKLFPHDSNFWGDFLTHFQVSKFKGSKFWYFRPHEQSYFSENPKHVILTCTSWALIVGRSKWC